MAKRSKEEHLDRYFQLHHYMMKTEAWRALSASARAVYIAIGFRYNVTGSRPHLVSRVPLSETRAHSTTNWRALHPSSRQTSGPYSPAGLNKQRTAAPARNKEGGGGAPAGRAPPRRKES